MKAGRQRIYRSSGNPPRRSERDEDLTLFHEMLKRERERNVSLLQPVSDEFEPNQGNYPFYKIPSGKRGAGPDFLTGEAGEKNDYDWLKTPPATPLFPSLEMEANDPNMVVYKEIPILYPLKPSRFSGKLEKAKAGHRPKSPSSKSTASSRSVTPMSRPPSSSGKTTNTKGTMNISERLNQANSNSDKRSNYSTITARPANPKEISVSSITSKKQNPDTKPRSRGVSPLVRSRLPSTLPGFSDETPPNLITSTTILPGRASSASRGRPSNAAQVDLKVEAGNPRRQSCSPSVTRGRKVEFRPDGEQNLGAKGKTNVGNGNLVVGSRMVEKMMNARRSVAVEDKDPKPKNRAPPNENSGFGRLVSRTSLDMALKHMEIKKNAGDLHQQKMGFVKSYTPTSVLSTDSTPQSTPGQETRRLRGRTGLESKNLIKKGDSRNRCGLC